MLSLSGEGLPSSALLAHILARPPEMELTGVSIPGSASNIPGMAGFFDTVRAYARHVPWT